MPIRIKRLASKLARPLLVATIFVSALAGITHPVFAGGETIDVGAAATDRASNSSSTGWTVIALDNPANYTGTINHIEVYKHSEDDITGLIVGSFFLVSGTTYECRDSSSIGTISGAEGLYELDAPGDFTAFDITADDYLGFYITGGSAEMDTSGGGGLRYATDEYIDPEDQTSYSLLSGYAISVYGEGIADTTPPTMDTNDATSVEETTATLDGDIDSVEGENADYRGFVWDTSTHGDPGDTAPAVSDYANYWTEGGDFGAGNFTHGITSLTQGELYYYRACAHNSAGWAYGDEVTFLTKPEAPTSLVATAGDTEVGLTWTKGTGAQKTYIRGEDGSYPDDRADGYEVYDDTGTSTTDTGLTNGHTYYYRAWSYATEGGLEQYSDNYDQDNASPVAFDEPTVTTNVSIGFGDTWAVVKGTIDDEGSAGVTQVGFDYGLSDSYGDEWTQSGTWTTDDTFVAVLTGLSKATVYHFRAKAYNNEWGYGSDLRFSTKGSPVVYESWSTGGDGDSDDIYANYWSAQSFTVGSISHTVTSVNISIKRVGSPGTIVISLKHADEDGQPTGADLTSTTLDGDAIPTTYTWYNLDLTETPIEAGELYAIVVRAVDGDDSNYVLWQSDTGGGTGSIEASNSTDGGISWSTDDPEDYLFEVWGQPCLDIDRAAAYSDYLENDDLLFLILYKNIYPPYYPSENPATYFYLQLLDTDGVTVLAQTLCKDWGYKPASIYLSADAASGLTLGSAYYIRIYGNFTGNPSDQYQLTSTDWISGGTNLDTWVINAAVDIEDYYTEFFGESYPLTTFVASIGRVLNDTGGALFLAGIPGLMEVRPNLFNQQVEYPSNPTATPTDAFSGATSYTAMVGTKAVAVAEDAADLVALEPQAVLGVGMLALYLVVAFVAVGIGRREQTRGDVSIALGLAIPFVIAAGIMRVVDIAIIAIIGIVALVLFAWSMWWSRT